MNYRKSFAIIVHTHYLINEQKNNRKQTSYVNIKAIEPIFTLASLVSYNLAYKDSLATSNNDAIIHYIRTALQSSPLYIKYFKVISCFKPKFEKCTQGIADKQKL